MCPYLGFREGVTSPLCFSHRMEANVNSSQTLRQKKECRTQLTDNTALRQLTLAYCVNLVSSHSGVVIVILRQGTQYAGR
jgi:hypothetical protein